MFGTNLTLQDSSVSKWVFIPDLKVLKYEVFNNYNFLWSNLKGLGMPLLGNGLQVAPMYPLTLICLLVPDPFFWNVFVIARWLILGVGSFLLAVRCFGLGKTGGLLFVLTFAFAFYELRWLNHPFLNGIAAGVWYLFFLLTIIRNTNPVKYFRRNTLHFIGLTISAYSILTCGFPEASICIASITLLTATVFTCKTILITTKTIFQILSIGTLLSRTSIICSR